MSTTEADPNASSKDIASQPPSDETPQKEPRVHEDTPPTETKSKEKSRGNDEDGGGKVEFEKEEGGGHKGKKEVKDVFDSIDNDNSGFIDGSELQAAAKKLGVTMSDAELKETLQRLDKNNDQKISFDEFYQWFSQRGTDRKEEPKALSQLRKKLFTYETVLDVQKSTPNLPYEIVETDEHYVLALELPGFTNSKAIKPKFHLTQMGFQVDVTADKKSALEHIEGVEILSTSRLLGPVQWHAEVRGVFDGRPEVNYKNGILKIRFKKRMEEEEEVDFDADF